MPFRRKLNRVSATFLALIIVATAYMCAAYSWIPGDVKSYADKPSTVENLDTFDFTLPHQKQGRKRVCLSFREEANATLTKNRTVSMTNFIGRLGNRISAVSKMVAFAESAGCDVALPRDLLDGWKSSHREWICSGPEVRKRSDSYEFCPERGGKEWFRTESFSAPVCHLKLLQAYFGINSTHVFDRQCLTQNHVALHIRSGDITAGSWDKKTGSYQSAPAGAEWASWYQHSLFPTSYYTSVIRNTRARRGHSTIFYVFCEDHGNPTCVFFQKLSSLDEKIVMRVGKELFDDLHLMLCASEVAESRGTFKLVFRLSHTVQAIHTFVDKPMECVDEKPQHSLFREIKSFQYWLKLAGKRTRYSNIMREWRNSGFQRHTMDAHYEIESCSNTLQLENDKLFSQRRSDVKLGIPL